jgi:methyl-accepting chemotaxis protein
MNKWTIGKRITFGFAAVIAIALALGGFAYARLTAINAHSEEIAKQAIPTFQLVFRMQQNAKNQQELIYKHIGSSDKEDMARLETEMLAQSADNTKIFEELDKLITDANERAMLEKIKAPRAEYTRLRADVLVLSRQGATNTQANAQAYDLARKQFDPANATYQAALDDLSDSVKASTDEASKNILTAVQGSKAGILIGLSLATLVGIGVAFMIGRGTNGVLRRVSASLIDGSNQVVSAAAQVSASSQSLAEGCSEQAASLEETSSSLEEMSSMTKRNSENARQANDLAKEARMAADKGVGDMQTMAAAMEAIKVSSDDIAKIIKTIDEIAFQTNILALNAAVEAARAGEAGMGFAVVADEVRNLAQRCAQAAKETSSKIEGAIIKTGQGVEISGKVAAALNEIVTKARKVDELVSEVAGASREQTEGITQVNTAVGQMDKVTQSNASTAEESAAAAQELNAQAETMKQSVAELLQLVGGNGGAETNLSAAAQAVQTRKAPAAPRPTAKRQNPPASHNGNGHQPEAPALATTASRRGEIPLKGDFSDF